MLNRVRCHTTSFWGQVFDFFAEAFKRDFPPCPLTALFGVVEPNRVMDEYEEQIISLSTLLARKLLLQRCKSEEPPLFRYVAEGIRKHFTFREMCAVLKFASHNPR